MTSKLFTLLNRTLIAAPPPCPRLFMNIINTGLTLYSKSLRHNQYLYLFKCCSVHRETFKTKTTVFDDILMETTQVCGVKLVRMDKRYMRQCPYSPAPSFVLET